MKTEETPLPDRFFIPKAEVGYLVHYEMGPACIFKDCPEHEHLYAEYVRADMVPRWHDADMEKPEVGKKVVVYLTTGNYTTAMWCGDRWSGSSTFQHSIYAWCEIPEYKETEK